MAEPVLPYIVEPTELAGQLTRPDMLIVDTGTSEQYLSGHVPGAVNLDYAKVRCDGTPTPGKLPSPRFLEDALREIGLYADSHVIAYDHENNARACRLLWVLEASSQFRHSLMNGGITAWKEAGLPMESRIRTSERGDFNVTVNPDVVADSDRVRNAIDDSSIDILDARSRAEYIGLKSASSRKGRIPGAIHLDWLDTVDQANGKRLKPRHELQELLDQRNLTPDREIIVHCQTHQRSSHSFVMLRHMGFKRIRGYGGSWSEWGNDPDLPLAAG